MERTKAIRHGDLALALNATLPKGLKPSQTNVLMRGNGGNDHAVKNGTVYLHDSGQYAIGYLVANDGCILLHPDHFDKTDNKNEGRKIKEAKIPTGTYQIFRQFEHKHESMTPVID